MRYCSVCLTTDLRPNASFSDDQVCIACEYAGRERQRDPALKLIELERRIRDTQRALRRQGPWDCIVGVSGGKDSTRQAHWVRDRLEMRPLLVSCAYPPRQMTTVGADNLANLISMGFDIQVLTPAPQTSASLSLTSFRAFGNVCKSTEMALFATVPRLAIDVGVNMIFWGENPALQVGDAATEGVDEFDGNGLRSLNTLTEGGTDWIERSVRDPALAQHYLYPDEIEFERKKISIFYLGAAWDDWSNGTNASYAALHGLSLRPGEEDETGDISNASMLDEEFTSINMMIKYFKFGFGRTTDYVNEEIRAQRMDRATAAGLVRRYDGVCGERIIRRYADYVGITVEEFWDITNQWVNPDLFELIPGARPRPKFTPGVDLVR